MTHRISFLLPEAGRTPVGGFKVVYEYANGLAKRGHTVSVVHPALNQREASLVRRCKRYARYLQHRIDGNYHPDDWFPLRRDVQLLWVPSLHPRHIPEGDSVVATSWRTAEWAKIFPPSKGAKIYFVQDYEQYKAAAGERKKRLAATFNMQATYIHISPAVQSMLSMNGVMKSVFVPNGIDFVNLPLQVSITDPRRTAIGFPAREEPYKRTQDAVTAIEHARRNTKQNVRIWSFGGEKPPFLPVWVEYHRRPTRESLRRLYSHTAIFVVPSEYEGWGLPGAEAMACGASLASTDNGGVRAYAADAETALLSPPRDPHALGQNIVRLLNDPQKRIALATAGLKQIKQFTWERALDAFETVIQGSEPSLPNGHHHERRWVCREHMSPDSRESRRS